LDDGQDEFDLSANVQTNLSTRLSNVSGDGNLVINAEDQGQSNFAMLVGALGNGSDTLSDERQTGRSYESHSQAQPQQQHCLDE